jgi:fumarate reductase flavoprotein subunit
VSKPDYDVIVVGGGGAGLAAATIAADNGARVLLVDAGNKMGGSTTLSGGVFYAAGTSLQKKAGIDDHPESQFRYYMNVNQHKLEASLVRRLCYDSAPTFEWLVKLGVRFPLENLYCSGVDGVRRGHRAEGHGAEIATVLEGSLTGKSVDTAVATRVRKLLVENNRVTGIDIGGDSVTAGAVVIATGGFGNNPRLLAELYPSAAKQGETAWYIGTPHSKGDGLEMGRAIGADITTPDRGLLLLTPGFVKELEPYLPPWLVHVNHEGRRFIDESTEYSVLAEVVFNQTSGECFAVFDEAARSTSKAQPAPNWSADRLAHFAETKQLAKAQTIEGLAEKLGIRPETLATTIAAFNQSVRDGTDAKFFKEAQHLKPIAVPPYYGARIRPAVVCWTGTGLRIDSEARVLDRADKPIAGVYAAGETTGGMFGQCYAGGGASIGNAIVFGRVAGRNAAALAKG